jgi:hypothetical protein
MPVSFATRVGRSRSGRILVSAGSVQTEAASLTFRRRCMASPLKTVGGSIARVPVSWASRISKITVSPAW